MPDLPPKLREALTFSPWFMPITQEMRKDLKDHIALALEAAAEECDTEANDSIPGSPAVSAAYRNASLISAARIRALAARVRDGV